jgi:hypothetical protein
MGVGIVSPDEDSRRYRMKIPQFVGAGDNGGTGK